RLGIHARTDAAPLRRSLQRRRCRLVTGVSTTLADKLVECRQTETPYSKSFTTTVAAARKPLDSFGARAKLREATEALVMLLRVCFRSFSDENRDGGRTSDWRSPLRIADSGPHSPSMGGETRGLRCDDSLAHARKSDYRDLSGWPLRPTWDSSKTVMPEAGIPTRLH